MPLVMRAIANQQKYQEHMVIAEYHRPTAEALAIYELEPKDLPCTIVLMGDEPGIDPNDPKQSVNYQALRNNLNFYDLTEFLRPYYGGPDNEANLIEDQKET